MNKFNTILESHENQIKAKSKAEEYLKKLNEHLKKLNNEKSTTLNKIEKSEAILNDSE